ncbi:hypothetical protein MSHOH_1961 [Methanosarcina horonobensis HB-1 = JCM 15518]|uniref:CRISPR-associated protein n=1 Tax=Methanosarcina horonobensis HB-1 = JCM 15518 TaxID=1434110 RepID=A0A0E3S9Y5_9EURY|nr:hypothetical protein [Methanosarcina horonobensis]AKB78444.1 hypothetical protein MSHOH_1961 [Methanosarcina horonobensis HB-1 = JCM 15518]
MSNKVARKLLNTNELVPFLIWSGLFAIFINLLSNILSYNIGNFQSVLIIVFLFLCLILLFVAFEKRNEKKLRKLIDSSINSRKLRGEYKGLIAFVSDNKEKGDKEKREYLEKCKKDIKNYKETGNVETIAGIRGIGQTFRALDYHLKTGKLRHCWLIYSDQSGVNLDVVKSFFEIVTENAIKPEPVRINDPNNSKHIKEIIDEIYDDLPSDLRETDIVADITAGNKPMTAAMVLSCLNSDRGLEYIEQSNKNELIEVNISPKFKGVEL